MVYSLLQELVRRDGLSVAISGRNEKELLPLLGYLVGNMIQQRFSDLLLDVCCIVVGPYQVVTSLFRQRLVGPAGSL